MQQASNIVEKAWARGNHIDGKLSSSVAILSSWSKATFGKFGQELKQCRDKMAKLMRCEQNDDTLAEIRALDSRMDKIEKKEELYCQYWHQRSRQSWIEARDNNIKSFHEKTKQCRGKNHIRTMKDRAGVEHDSEEQIPEVLVLFQRTL